MSHWVFFVYVSLLFVPTLLVTDLASCFPVSVFERE